MEIPEKGKTALKDALKKLYSKPQNGYQSFLAKSCDFFGLRPDQTSGVLKAAQGENGIAERITAPIGATLSAAVVGTYNRMKNAYHSVFPPKNEQTHPINTQKPQYREWKNKDGERVSPVQYRQILDMDKDIIQKPTKSYADERKNADKKKKTQKIISQQKMPEIKIPQNDYLEQNRIVQSNKPIIPTLSSSVRHLNLQSDTSRKKIKDDSKKAYNIINSLNIKNIKSYVEESQKKMIQSIDDKKNNIPVSGSNGKTQNLKEKIQKDKHSADNKYQQQMIAMIQNMNKINGQQKSIDAQKTTNILYQKYGDNAYNLLLKAIQEPTIYSQIAGDSNIKTSHAAVQHLSAMENNEKTQMIINKLLQKSDNSISKNSIFSSIIGLLR